MGTGPFKFVSRTAQDSIVLERFDGYWGTPAQLDKVTFRIIENADSLVMSLQSGAIDMFAHLTSTQAAQLGDDFQVLEGTMNLVQALYLNNAAEPFNNERSGRPCATPWTNSRSLTWPSTGTAAPSAPVCIRRFRNILWRT